MTVQDIGKHIHENAPMEHRTTLGINSSARYILHVTEEEMLKPGLLWARERQLPVLVLGGGSNLVLSDEPYPGLVIHMATRGHHVVSNGERVWLSVAAGENWDDFVATTVASDWAGLECLSGIPGKVGAAPIQNIGAYGCELADVLTDVFAMDTETLEKVKFTKEECGFGYRDSIFKSGQRGRYIVTRVCLELREDGKPIINYPDLNSRLSEDATLQQVRDKVLEVRRSKSMVLDRHDPNTRSCGSFFTNPILSQAQYAAFAEKAPEHHPSWPAGSGLIKLSAAWLIDNAGFHKGYEKGRAGLSQNHCLAIINRGGATSAEIKALKDEIQKGVAERFGIHLEPEPVIL